MAAHNEPTTRAVPARHAPIIDAHVHFWDPGTLHYPWLNALPTLERSFLPADYAATVGELPVERCVVVEANCLPAESVDEVRLFERLAHTDPRIAGVIAFVDLTEPRTCAAMLECLTALDCVKGIRQNIQGQPRGFALQSSFIEGVRQIARRLWTFDLCITHDQLDEIIALVERCPDVQFVLDHCGKPGIRLRVSEPWRRNLTRLAAHDNVCCKLSGLLTEADLSAWRVEDLLPYAMHAVECFGTDRLLYGSDWPVLTLAGDYASWFGFTARLTESWTEGERLRFYSENAARVYGL